jgi:hypothetical protein
MLKTLSFFAVLLLLTACAGQPEAPTPPPDSSTPSQSTPSTTSGQALVWAQGEEGGQLLLVNNNSSIEVMPLTANTLNVAPCGTVVGLAGGSVSPSVYFSILTGDQTSIHQMNGVDPQLVTVEQDMNPMTCVGDNFQYRPSTARLGYLKWDSTNVANLTPTADLILKDSTTNQILTTLENVASFDMTGENVGYVAFFPNNQGEMTEVSISDWNGTSTREGASFNADSADNCRYSSADIRAISSGTYAVILGKTCDAGRSIEVHQANFETSSVTLLVETPVSGNFFNFSNTTNIYSATDTETVYITTPDNTANDSAGVYSLAVNSPTPNTLIERFGVMPQVNNSDRNHTPMLSADGRWLAFVQNTANDRATLYVMDMNTPTLAPITIAGGSDGDAFTGMAFDQPNGTTTRLFYVSGSASNSLFSLDLTTGISTRIARGQFLGDVQLSPDESTIVLSEARTARTTEPVYEVLVFVSVVDGTKTDILTGVNLETLTTDRIEGVRRFRTLAWR